MRIEVGVDVGVELRGEPLDLDIPGEGDIAAGPHGIIIVHRSDLPSRLLGSRRKASEQTRKPEADTAFIRHGAGRRGQHSPDENGQPSRDSARIAPRPKSPHCHPQITNN
jgi:hypothetical protein